VTLPFLVAFPKAGSSYHGWLAIRDPQLSTNIACLGYGNANGGPTHATLTAGLVVYLEIIPVAYI
jgi:hypothetical protein